MDAAITYGTGQPYICRFLYYREADKDYIWSLQMGNLFFIFQTR